MPLTQTARLRTLLAIALMAGVSSPAFTQATTSAAQKTPPPDTPAPTIYKAANSMVEVGTIDGVPYRIDLPNNWNHNLVVYYHGYSHSPLHYKPDAPETAKLRGIIHKGYAVVQSAYSQTGWAVQWGYSDTEKLRKYFVKKMGQPKETYVAGESMGGALTMMTIEKNPKPYTGALNLCGAVGSTYSNLQRRFTLRAAFDYYFPNLLPSLPVIPANFVETEALRQKVFAALNAKPAGAEAMRRLTDLHTNAEVARMMVYFTFVLADIQHKAGGNPFDNRDTIYMNTSDDPKTDYALNDGVSRFGADARARKYVLDYYEGTGHVTRPTVALHTVYDPVIPTSRLTPYLELVTKTGHGGNYVQQYVHREGHCNMTPDEVTRAFDELVNWVHTNRPPAAGFLR